MKTEVDGLKMYRFSQVFEPAFTDSHIALFSRQSQPSGQIYLSISLSNFGIRRSNPSLRWH